MTDPYERDQMPGVGEVLYRHKVTSPRWAFGLALGVPLGLACLAAAGLAIGGQLLAAASIIGGSLAFSAIMGFVLVTFATARVAVSEGEIYVQIGFAGPKIPIGEVASVRIAPSGTNRLGMGARNDLRGTTIVSMWGDNERAVHIERTNGKKLVLVCKDPDAMAQAIQEALVRRDHGAPKVRVPGPDADVVEAGVVESDVEGRTDQRKRHQQTE